MYIAWYSDEGNVSLSVHESFLGAANWLRAFTLPKISRLSNGRLTEEQRTEINQAAPDKTADAIADVLCDLDIIGMTFACDISFQPKILP